MRYTIGDRVRITTDKSKSRGWNPDGKMDKWLGKVMTIRDIQGRHYRMKEDRKEFFGDGWFWSEDMIGGLASSKSKKQEVKHGKWEKAMPRRKGRNATYRCSCCGQLRSSYYNDVQNWEYCPCGAKMDKE